MCHSLVLAFAWFNQSIAAPAYTDTRQNHQQQLKKTATVRTNSKSTDFDIETNADTRQNEDKMNSNYVATTDNYRKSIWRLPNGASREWYPDLDLTTSSSPSKCVAGFFSSLRYYYHYYYLNPSPPWTLLSPPPQHNSIHPAAVTTTTITTTVQATTFNSHRPHLHNHHNHPTQPSQPSQSSQPSQPSQPTVSQCAHTPMCMLTFD